jgi:hypothetical protein
MATYGGITLNGEQLKNASLIASVGRKMGASKRDIQVAIMTAMTESNLRNLNFGDRDSLGLFQQRGGWGSASQRMDPSHAATSFYKELFKVKNRNGLQPWQAAQAVQRSAFSDGSNYKNYWALGQQVAGKSNYGGGSFNASSDTGGYVMAPPLSPQELAEKYGFAMAFLKSHPDVYSKFQQAVKHTWTPDHFVAQLKNTKWWKTTANSVRQYQILKAQDPATLKARQQALSAQIADSANTLGASLSKSALARITTNALMFGWNDNQVRDTLSSYVHTMNGVYNGQAGADADQLRQTAWRNGLRVSSATLQGYVQSIAAGKTSVNHYQDLIRKQAKTLAPGFADQIDSGMDLWDIASPYMQAKAQLLQQDPAKIDLFDTDVRQALSAKGADGKPTSMSLWEFEDKVRQNPAYMKTDQARDAAYNTAHKVLQDFGFMGS